jgi:hypothetical protein
LACIDTGAEGSLISEAAYQSITATGYASLQFPVKLERICHGLQSQEIKTSIVLEFRIDGDIFEHTFLVTPKLKPILLGADFLQKNNIVIDIHGTCFWKGGKKDDRRYMFSSEAFSFPILPIPRLLPTPSMFHFLLQRALWSCIWELSWGLFLELVSVPAVSRGTSLSAPGCI